VDHVRALANSSLAPRLRHLDLFAVRGGDVMEVLASPAFSGLTSLVLKQTQLGRAGAEALARGPWRGLTRLVVDQCKLDIDALAVLLAPGALPRLTILDAIHNGISVGSAQELQGRQRLAQLSVAPGSLDVPPLVPLEHPAAFPRRR
jgi:hypothetical protein